MAIVGDATSVQVNLLSTLLHDDDIVRAIAIDNPDFLSEKYIINNSILNEQITDDPRQIIRNGEIYRYALKMERIMPYMYDEKTFTAQGVYIMYGVNEVLNARDYITVKPDSSILKTLYLDVNVVVHHNLIDNNNSNFSGTRIDFISDKIIELINGNYLGRNMNKSFSPFIRKDNLYGSIMNGRWHGRKIQFIATSKNVNC